MEAKKFRRIETRTATPDDPWFQKGYTFTSTDYDRASDYIVDDSNGTVHLWSACEEVVGEFGWVGYNSGPCGWFWSKDRAELEHELTDEIRPATHLEKAFFNSIGNNWILGEKIRKET